MARQTRTAQPESALPLERPMMTSGLRPEHLQLDTLNRELSSLQKSVERAVVTTESLQSKIDEMGKQISEVDKFHQRVIGGGKVAALVVVIVISLLSWLLGSKVSTLLQMADERQVQQLHGSQAESVAQPTEK